jgi:small-conductance mechanosensitive channel
MSRRRRKSSPFSLFSFQDIITSVTAVIILITLILALDLITRQPDSTTSQPSETVRQLKSSNEQAELERQALQNRLAQEASRTVKYASSTSDFIQRDLNQTQEQIGRLRYELEQLREREKSATQQENAALARSLDQDGARNELNDLEEKVGAVESQQEEIRTEGHLIFNRPVGTSRRPWLLDISGDSIVVLPFASDGQRYEFHSRLLNACTDQLLAWVRSNCNPQSDSFVLLVRPSGIENAETLRDALIDRTFELGRDVVGATQKVVIGTARGTP